MSYTVKKNQLTFQKVDIWKLSTENEMKWNFIHPIVSETTAEKLCRLWIGEHWHLDLCLLKCLL